MFGVDDISQEDREPIGSKELRAAFPVFMQKDFEGPVNNAAYQVGVDKSYPSRLRKMISASILTYQLNNKSVDYVLRKYLNDKDYEEKSPDRLDKEFRSACLEQVSLFQAALKIYPPFTQREPRVGEWVGDLTAIRMGYSLQRAFGEADKGALFEAVAIARMILEQLAWAAAVRGIDDASKVQQLAATKSIGLLNANFPIAGRLYGWMSNHAHWGYDAHYKVITSKDGFSGAWLFNTEFKAIAYAMLIALTLVISQVGAVMLNEYPELHLTAEFKRWDQHRISFDGGSMIEKISGLDQSSSDIQAILNIVKVAANHG